MKITFLVMVGISVFFIEIVELCGNDIVHSKHRLVETTNTLVDMCLTKTFG